MTNEPFLILAPGYGPFIHTGARNSANRKAVRQPHPDTFGLWASLDGTLTLDDGEHRPSRRLPGPVAVFVVPHPHRSVSVTAGSEWYYLRFDVVDRPRRRIPRRRAWCHDGPVAQPSPQAIWGTDPPTVVPDHLREGTVQLLRDCCALWWRNDHYHAQSNASLGHWLMDYVIQHRVGSDVAATGHGVHQKCRELVHERLGLGLDVADLAAACGFSRVHFSRRFKAETGMTPGSFIHEERMAHAGHLLASTDLGLAAVAERCGYRSVAAFSQAFVRQHGSRPGAWRRRYR